jgi:hypothetical protein
MILNLQLNQERRVVEPSDELDGHVIVHPIPSRSRVSEARRGLADYAQRY